MNSRIQPVTYDLSDGKSLDQAIYNNIKCNDRGELNVAARLTPPPAVGDTVLMPDGRVWQFTEARPFPNSQELYACYVKELT